MWGQYFVKSNLFKADKVEVESYLKYPELRLTVDTPEDFELMTKIYEELYPKNNSFTLKDVVKLLNEDKPELKKINMKIKQKTPKSIENKELIKEDKSMFIPKEIIQENFEQLVSENKLSLVYNENPKMFFINLPAGFKGEEEVHEDEDDLYIIIKGAGILIVDSSRKLEVKEGDVIHIPAKQVHKLEYTKNGIQYIVVKI